MLRGYLLVLTAAVLWGLIGPVARFAFAEGVQPMELAFWRALFASVLYVIHARLPRRIGRVQRRDLLVLAGFGLVGVAFFYTAVMYAVETGGAALASVLLYTAPAWVALGAWLLFGEPPDRRTTAAMSLALAGVAVVAFAGGGETRFTAAAIAWGLASGFAYALYYLVGRRYFAEYGTGTVMAIALPVGALVLLPFVSGSVRGIVGWSVVAFLAVVPTYAAYLIYGAGLMRIGATRSATVASLEPVIAAIAALMLWGETLGTWGYVGAAIVLSAVLLIATGRATETPARRPAVE